MSLFGVLIKKMQIQSPFTCKICTMKKLSKILKVHHMANIIVIQFEFSNLTIFFTKININL